MYALIIKQLRNVRHTTLFILIPLLSSCFVSDYESELINSPTKKYSIKATVNRTNKSLENYANVFIHIYDLDNVEISVIDTNAGDANKWAIGWAEFGDTIVLFSSDIGNKAWRIIDTKPLQIEVGDKLNQRAFELKKEKYS